MNDLVVEESWMYKREGIEEARFPWGLLCLWFLILLDTVATFTVIFQLEKTNTLALETPVVKLARVPWNGNESIPHNQHACTANEPPGFILGNAVCCRQISIRQYSLPLLSTWGNFVAVVGLKGIFTWLWMNALLFICSSDENVECCSF